MFSVALHRGRYSVVACRVVGLTHYACFGAFSDSNALPRDGSVANKVEGGKAIQKVIVEGETGHRIRLGVCFVRVKLGGGAGRFSCRSKVEGEPFSCRSKDTPSAVLPPAVPTPRGLRNSMSRERGSRPCVFLAPMRINTPPPTN